MVLCCTSITPLWPQLTLSLRWRNMVQERKIPVHRRTVIRLLLPKWSKWFSSRLCREPVVALVSHFTFGSSHFSTVKQPLVVLVVRTWIHFWLQWWSGMDLASHIYHSASCFMFCISASLTTARRGRLGRGLQCARETDRQRPLKVILQIQTFSTPSRLSRAIDWRGHLREGHLLIVHKIKLLRLFSL